MSTNFQHGIELAGVAVTATAAELNNLDGVTATAAELNKLASSTVTAAELNEPAGRDVQYCVLDTATLAQINAGKTVLAAVAGKTVKVLDFLAKVSGTFADVTTVDLKDTNTSPVTIASLAVAQLTDGTVLRPGDTGVTLGAGFMAALTAGKGIQVVKSGSDATGGTSITLYIAYTLV